MDSNSFKQVEEIFNAARQLTGQQRDQYLSGACEGDPNLRQEVEKLLAHHEDTKGVLKESELQGQSPQDSDTFELQPSELGGQTFNPSETVEENSLVGKKIGGCEILSLIGEGGMGAVYRARQVEMDRLVAVKTIRQEVGSDSSFVERFQQEAKNIAKFNTPHVTQAYGTGFERGVYFIIMEFVDGDSLEGLVAKKPDRKLTPKEGLFYLRQAVKGLVEAENLEMIHRDIKPANLLIDAKNRLKIADFGIAKIVDQSPQLTASGGVVGTPLYLSPEQARGEEYDHRSDIFSLGATFYYLLTGEQPVRGDSIYELIQHKQKISKLQPNLPDKSAPAAQVLNVIIPKMTALKAKDRYSSFSVLLEEIDRLEKAAESNGTTRASSPLKWIATLILVALGVILYFTIFSDPDPSKEEDPKNTSSTSQATNEKADQQKRIDHEKKENEDENKNLVTAPKVSLRWDSTGSNLPMKPELTPGHSKAVSTEGMSLAVDCQLGDITIQLAMVPAQDFEIGTPPSELGRSDDERSYLVSLKKSFYIGVTEITNRQYRWFKPEHHSGSCKEVTLNEDDQPVVNLTWAEAVSFTQALNEALRDKLKASKHSEYEFRLPTEAEWEIAARATKKDDRYWGKDRLKLNAPLYSNIGQDPNKCTFKVGDIENTIVSPNSYGLFDVIGNVREWCYDWYGPYPQVNVIHPSGPQTGLKRVCRGGSFQSEYERCRSGARDSEDPAEKFADLGFRIVLAPKITR